MPRTARAAPPDFVYHVLNRAVARLPLFQKDGDYQAFERVLAEALVKHPRRSLGYCLMPNHAEKWRWSSLWRRLHPGELPSISFADWPMPMPDDWVGRVNRAQTEAELEASRRSVCRGTPYGNPGWQEEVSRRLGLQFTLRGRGRPRLKK
jgi:hypothetical protein